MKVDVIVPCYNEADWVTRVLEPLSDSDFVHNVIIVNDASTDDSALVIQSFAKDILINLISY